MQTAEKASPPLSLHTLQQDTGFAEDLRRLAHLVSAN